MESPLRVFCYFENNNKKLSIRMLNSHRDLKYKTWSAIISWCCKKQTVSLWTMSKRLVTSSHFQARVDPTTIYQ